MIDLHTHVLPAVDDGVETEDEAVEFVRVAAQDGVRVIVATPHCRDGFYQNDRTRVLAEVEHLRDRLARERIDVAIEPGAEVHLCPDLVERVRDGRAPTLSDNRRTLLLELSLSQYPIELENLVFQLRLAGIEVVFAHPERIRYFQDDIARYEAVVHAGAYGQVTTGSILGVFGRTARAFSVELLRKGLVHVIASDAHNVRGRPPGLRVAVSVAEELVGAKRAEAMVQGIPAALLAGRDPEIPPVDPPRAGRGFLGRIFGRRT